MEDRKAFGAAFDLSAIPVHSKQRDSSCSETPIPQGWTTGLTDAGVGKRGRWPDVTGNGNGKGPAQPPPLAAPTGKVTATPPTPPRLTKKTVVAPIGGECGAFNWTVSWALDKATTTGGWIVQKVELPYDVKKCDGTAVSANASGLNPSWYPIWEAWQVNKNERVTIYAGTYPHDDQYSNGGTGDGTKGSLTVKGTAEYYDNLTLPASFKVTNKAPAGILPVTTSTPTLTGGTGAISHELKASWDCCVTGKGAAKTTTVTTK